MAACERFEVAGAHSGLVTMMYHVSCIILKNAAGTIRTGGCEGGEIKAACIGICGFPPRDAEPDGQVLPAARHVQR